MYSNLYNQEKTIQCILIILLKANKQTNKKITDVVCQGRNKGKTYFSLKKKVSKKKTKKINTERK